jgi:6,7-dimethyl-8-ribityllumazine synthase
LIYSHKHTQERRPMKTGHSDIEGNTDGKGKVFAIVASRFNHDVTSRLVDGARECLLAHGVAAHDIHEFWCPGALEIPALVARIAMRGVDGQPVEGIVCVGCVIKGDTDHYQFVCAEAMRGITMVAVEAEVAIGNSILTVHEAKQAQERSQPGQSNKGWEAALAALEMANHYAALK